jgi:branched-chain amino acid transport system substrate-binding protein
VRRFVERQYTPPIREVRVQVFSRLAAAATIASLAAYPAHAADITVGLITSLTGPGASIGIPYAKGIAAGIAYKDDVNGIKVKAVQLDDASDPSTGTRDARKLIEQDKVDVLLGAGSTPITLAINAVAHELKVPLIALTPTGDVPGDAGSWMISVPQPPPMMVEAVVKRMTAGGVKTVGYIGYNDAWGDLVYNALKKTADPAGLQIVANERYARADTSVTAQALHLVAAAPEVVMMGGSGTPGALPFIALADRGYKGQIYGTHALINPDFIRVGGSAVEGVRSHAQDLDGLPRGLSEGEQRTGARRLRALCVRRLADRARCGQARLGDGCTTGHAGIPRCLARCDRDDQRARRHARGL